MEKTCVNKEKGNNTDLCKLRQCKECKEKDNNHFGLDKDFEDYIKNFYIKKDNKYFHKSYGCIGDIDDVILEWHREY